MLELLNFQAHEELKEKMCATGPRHIVEAFYRDEEYEQGCAPLLGGQMKAAQILRSASVVACMALSFIIVTSCASTKTGGAPPVETAIPAPVVDQAAIQAMGPPPGSVKPENYWVREKIILTSAPEPSAPATPKSTAKKAKKTKKAGKQ
jgi:hypothetical protein